MPRADVIASIFKETGSTGVADAVKSLGGLVNCSNAGEAAKILLGASVGGGASLLALVGGSLLDHFQRKKDMKELKYEFRKVHRSLQALERHQIDSKEWVGLLNEIAQGQERGPASQAELHTLQTDLHAAMRAQLAAQSKDIDAWFRSVGIYLSNIDARLRSVDAKQDTLLEGQGRIEKVLSDSQLKDQTIGALANELASRSAEAASLRGENETLKAAISRYVNATPAKPWREAIAELRGEPHHLVTFLDDQVDKDEAELIEKHRERAAVCLTVGEIPKAVRSLEHIIALRPADRDALNSFARAMVLLGRTNDARRLLHRAVLVTESALEKSRLLANLGAIEISVENYDHAEKLIKQSIELSGNCASPQENSIRYGNLGITALAKNKLGEAEALHRKALNFAIRSGRHIEIANQYGSLGVVAMRRRRIREAVWNFEKSIDYYSQIKHKEGIAKSLANLGSIAMIEDKPEDALRLYKDALVINMSLQHVAECARNNNNIGSALAALGRSAEARTHFETALLDFQSAGIASGAKMALENLGKLRLGRHE